MKESISSRQLGVLCAVSIFANKILLLPSLLYENAKSDGLFVVGLLFLVDLLILFSFFHLKKKFPVQSFKEILIYFFGKIVTKVIFLAFAVFFMFKVFLIYSTSFIYLKQQVYQGEFAILAIICVLPVINHAALTGLRSMARTIEMFFYIVAFGFVLCLAISTLTYRSSPLFFTSSLGDFASTAFRHIFSFGDYLFLFLIIDKVTLTQKDKKRVLKYVFFAIFLVLALFFLFYSLYQITAFMHNNALSDILIFSVVFNAVGRIDIIAMLTIMFLAIFQMELFHYCFCDAFVNFLPKLNKIFAVITFDIFFFIVYLMLIGKYENMVIQVEVWLPYLTIVLNYLLPLLLGLFSFKKKSVKNQQIIPNDEEKREEKGMSEEVKI